MPTVYHVRKYHNAVQLYLLHKLLDTHQNPVPNIHCTLYVCVGTMDSLQHTGQAGVVLGTCTVHTHGYHTLKYKLIITSYSCT